MTNQTVQATQITREIAQKVLTTIDAGLVNGLGRAVPGEMCVEAAVCYALGLPHGDDPGCVADSLRRLKIRLNNASWSSRQARASGLRRLGLAQLGSKDVLDEREFVARVVRLAITKQVPSALRAAVSHHKDPKHQETLCAAAKKCESDADYASCIEARDAAEATDSSTARRAACAVDAATNAARAACAVDAAANAAANAAADAADDDHDAAAYVADAADYTAACAARAADAAWGAYRDYGTDTDASNARDKSLAEFAEDVVQVLIEMKAPGCEWLDLTKAA